VKPLKFLIEIPIPFTNRKFYHSHMTGITPKRDERTAGLINRTLDLKFLPFFDWDLLAYEMLVVEANVLQREFKLSDLYLFHSKDHEDGWNALTLDKLNHWDCYDVIKRSTCDRNYVNCCYYTPSKSWTMRFLEKGNRDRVEYYGVIPSCYQEREKSRAHAELIETFEAEVNWKGKFDEYHLDTIEEFEGIKLFNGMRDKIKMGGVTSEAYNTGSHTTKESLKGFNQKGKVNAKKGDEKS
jgi:hypothetical protein